MDLPAFNTKVGGLTTKDGGCWWQSKILGSGGDNFEVFHSSDVTFPDLTKFSMELKDSNPEIVLVADIRKYALQYSETIL